MTGFSDSTQTAEFGAVTVEIKSVNGRFLELTLRLPEELRYAESAVRERIGAAVARGKLDCRLSITRHPMAAAARINETALVQLGALERQVHEVLPHASPMGVADVLRWPGVIETEAADPEAWRAPLMRALDDALDGLIASRLREGSALCAALIERCDRMEAILVLLRASVPRILADMERRLNERMIQALGNALAGGALSREEINERIRQELTLHGMRSDVAEEIDRLTAHVTEVRRILQQGGAVGRRLDFLMQELNREANTIASKANVIDMTTAAVELKLLIEQMREQVQNLE
ncbi:MAG TPA: YicC/YloC family endoribonuclease [Burkholderiaceae bacterium]|nr:YicC/YloC family endoribonuclease [Burkholderiaceae bacterium]